MGTKTILLWLEAPLQSWGCDSKFNRRDSLDFPTKSGVLGIVLCAMGASGEQRELLARFASLKQMAISFGYASKGAKPSLQPLLRDFQMIGSGYNDKDEWEKNFIPKTKEGKPAVGGGTKLTYRFYLQNATFAVLLETPEDLAESVAEALKNPVYPIYLGRRCCVPTDFVFQGIFDDFEKAENAAMEKAQQKSNEQSSFEELFRVCDGDFAEGDAFTLNDIPIQFGERKLYRERRVTKIVK